MGKTFFAWLFLIAVTGFALGGSIEATLFQPIVQQSEANNHKSEAAAAQGEETQCEKIPFWNWWTCDPVAYFTFLIAAFTCFLGIFTAAFWIVTYALFRETGRTSKQQLRAYIFAEEFNTYRFALNKSPHIHIILKNSGQTPAWNIRCRYHAKILPYPSAENIIPDDDERPVGAIGPGDHQSLAIEIGALSLDDMQAIMKGTRAIYAAGRIEYEDAFRRPQWMTFRCFYGGPLGPSSEGVMGSAHEGNDASR